MPAATANKADMVSRAAMVSKVAMANRVDMASKADTAALNKAMVEVVHLVASRTLRTSKLSCRVGSMLLTRIDLVRLFEYA